MNLLGPKTITTIAYFNNQDSWIYHVKCNMSKYKNDRDKPIDSQQAEYDLHIRVIDSTENSYTLVMTYSNFVVSGVKDKYGIDESLRKLTENLQIKYGLNELGVYDTIMNNAELAATMDTALTILKDKFDSILQDEKAKIEFSAKYQSFREVMSRPENVTASCLTDILNIHGLYGIELTMNEPLLVEMEYVTLNNFILPGTGTVTLKSIDKNRGVCKLSIVQKPDRTAIKEYMVFILKILDPEMEIEDGDFENYNFKTNTKENYQMSLSTGWMNKIEVETTSTVTKGKRSIKHVSSYEYVLK